MILNSAGDKKLRLDFDDLIGELDELNQVAGNLESRIKELLKETKKVDSQ